MGNDYDRIIKENIEAVILPLMEKLTGLPQPKKLENIPDELQLTLERKPDFSRIATESESKRYLLHIEFQVADESNMVLRMQTYRALFQEIYRLLVEQFVFYLGQKAPKMVSRIADLIPGDENNFSFSLVNTQQYDYQSLINSRIPEEIIFAIVGDFKNEQPEKIVNDILKRLLQISQNKKKLQRYIQQLLVLSKLRNLEAETLKQTEAMPIEFDISKDVVYQKGKLEAKKTMITEMLKDGSLPLEKIAAYASVTVDEVVAIQQEITNTK